MRGLTVVAIAAVAALSFAPSRAEAQGTTRWAPRTPGVGFVVEGALEFGGDELVKLTFTDGSQQTLRAGQGGSIGGGVQWRPAALPKLSLAATAGFKFVSNASENADIGITRIPLELVGRYDFTPDWWGGLGLVAHTNVKIEGDNFFPDATLDSPVGPTIQVGWRWVGLRYTKLTYENGPQRFDAGAIGVSFRWVSGAH